MSNLYSSIKILSRSFVLAYFIFSQYSNASCQEKFKTKIDCCDYWSYVVTGDKSKFATFMQYQKDSIYLRHDEESIMCGIECLLNLEGNKNKSCLGANISNLTSDTGIPNPSVEIAALYQILNIYGLVESVHVIRLYDNDGNPNTEETIKKAYRYYREWFEEVKKVGIVKAREMGLHPLKNKDIFWWGPVP
jgi:hypothetical protein